MPEPFDPYYKWLGIAPKDQPPNHYRLLGLDLFEPDREVIDAAADRQMAHVRTFHTGKYAGRSQQLLNEIAAARICLLDSHKKESYDRRLRSTLAPPSGEPPAVSEQARPPNSSPATPGHGAAEALPLPRLVAPSRTTVFQAPGSFVSLVRQPFVWAAAIVGACLGTVLVVAVVFRGQPRSASTRILRGVTVNNTGGFEEPTTAPPSPSPPISRETTAQTATATDPVPAAAEAAAVPWPPTSASPGDLGRRDDVAPTSSQHRAGDPAPISQGAPAAELPAPLPAATAESDAGRTVDLLPLIDPSRDAVNGTWRREAATLVSPPRLNWARIQVPYSVPPEYRLEAVVERWGIDPDNIEFGLVAGGAQFVYCVEAFGKGGLFLLDGREWHVNETSYRGGNLFRNEKPTTIVCVVRHSEVQAFVDGRQVLSWHGSYSRLSVQPAWRVPDTSRLFLGTCRDYRFTKLELTPLGEND